MFSMKWMLWTVAAILAILALAPTAQAADPNENPGITGWVLGGSGVQELRIGYEGLLPTIEFAAGIRHLDVLEAGVVEQWPIRGYAIAHALDTTMLASVLGADFKLPNGNVYGGLFGEYAFDRENELSGGYVVGGLVDWPRGWQTVIEYDATVFNCTKQGYEFLIGLRRQF